MHRYPLARSRAVLLLMLWLAAGCGKRAHSGIAPALRGGATVPPSSEAAVAPLAQPAAEPPAKPMVAGEWTETASFRFRVTDLKRCRAPSRARVATPPRAAGARGGVTPASDEPVRLAVAVQVQAHYDLFVSPRDLALERDGVILASDPDPGRAAGCGRLLQPQSLRQGQTASGAVVFALPEGDARASVLVFSPTRWGGAPRVALVLPD